MSKPGSAPHEEYRDASWVEEPDGTRRMVLDRLAEARVGAGR